MTFDKETGEGTIEWAQAQPEADGEADDEAAEVYAPKEITRWQISN